MDRFSLLCLLVLPFLFQLSLSQPPSTSPNDTPETEIDAAAGHHGRHLDSRAFLFQIPEHPIGENSTFRWLMDRLVDLGYYTVGVSADCRENSVCHAANELVNGMPAFIITQGVDKINQLPYQALGSHEFTSAWMVGLGAGNESTICDTLYDCDKTTQDAGNLSTIDQIMNMAQVWAQSGQTVNLTGINHSQLP